MSATALRNPVTVSVVIPCYNAADWLEGTITRIASALERAGLEQAEVILVDDGSTDGSAAVARSIKTAYPVVVIEQPNAGRFLARKAGVQAAKHEFILFIDTRVHLHEDAMKFVIDQLIEHPDKVIWNGHVYVAKQGNIIARFGDAITFIGWRRYFGHPKTTSYGLKDFDYYPKGTGCFFVPRTVVEAAIKEFESTTTDLKFSSDDTLMIRLMAREHRINLSPQFSCTYHARTNLKQFVKHTYHRGQFFVDGFLRRGTRFFWPLIAFLAGCVLALILAIIWPRLLLVGLAMMALAWLFELLGALALRVPLKDALSLFALSPLFAVCYAGGIWRAVIRKFGRV